MWEFKSFDTMEKAEAWIAKNQSKYQCELVYIHNGYGVEYRKLRRM